MTQHTGTPALHDRDGGSADDEAFRERVLTVLRELLTDDYVPGGDVDPSGITLAVPSYGTDEIIEVLDSLLTGRVTYGEKVRRFEDAFAAYVGRRHAIMVNSGSSAMLLALSVLSSPLVERPLRPGDEVITTAIPWSTTVAPVVQMGCIPVFVDIDRETLNIDVARIEDAISDRTRAIMPVHLLGNPVDMDAVLDIAERHDLLVVEDCCEAHGAATGGRRVGSFGTFSAFSFYFSHHISTIEGGLLLTDDDRLADIARSMRSHGWLRDVRGQWDFTGDSAEHPADWTFVVNGYNLRPTELQGAFGIHQLGKLEGFVERRRQTARFWNESLSRFAGVLELPAEREHSRHVWFAYPILVRPGAPFTRAALLDFLNQRGIETRPVVAGNFVRQPVTKTWKHRTDGDLAAANFVHEQGFLVGNHHRVSDEARQGLVDAITAFLDAAASRPRGRAA